MFVFCLLEAIKGSSLSNKNHKMFLRPRPGGLFCQDADARAVISDLGGVGAGLGLDLEPLVSDVGDDFADIASDIDQGAIFEFIVRGL